VLLTRRDSVPPTTLKALTSLGVTSTIVAGGPGTISDTTLGELPSPTRVSGADRYAVAANVAALGLEGTAGLLPTLRPDRMIVASGDSWTDALLGASLGARLRAPLLLTKGNRLPGATSDILKANAAQVLNCYVIGGSGTVNAATARAIAGAFGG
jgi:N-acetylmuramoyl-L-alanine amidase